MIIHVEKRDNPFVMIDRRVILDKRLTYAARGLLASLLAHPPEWEVNIADLINGSPKRREYVQGCLKELEFYGYASLIYIPGPKGRKKGKKWIVREIPVNNENNMSDNRQTGNPFVGATDERENRRSVKPTIGKTDDRKSRLYSNNNSTNNTDTTNNTVLYSTDEKNFPEKSPVDALPDNTPPFSAPPPPPLPGCPAKLETFRESLLYQNGIEMFSIALITAGAPQETNFRHFYNRILEWSDKKNAKSKNWIGQALKFIKEDIKTTTTAHNTTAHNTTANKYEQQYTHF